MRKDGAIKVKKDPYESGKSEREVHKECLAGLEKMGIEPKTIYCGGIPVKRGGKIILVPNPAVGIADIFMTAQNYAFWAEIKKNAGGYWSADQQAFAKRVRSAGMVYFLVTSWTMLEEQLTIKLVELGLL